MKKIILMLFISLLLFTTTSFAKLSSNPELNLGRFLSIYFTVIGKNIGDDYKSISLKNKTIDPDSTLYRALQKGIYMGYRPNTDLKLDFDSHLKQEFIARYLEIMSDRKYDYDSNKNINMLRTLQTINTTTKSPIYKDHLWDLDSEGNPRTEEEQRQYAKRFSNIYYLLQEDFLYPEQLSYYKNYDSIESFVNSIEDEHTDYLSPEITKIFYDPISGEFVGIGVYLSSPEPGTIIIDDLVKDGPAHNAGVQIGDQIIEIDGKKIIDEGLENDILDKLSGENGTVVNLKLLRNNEIISVNITREIIILNSVHSNTLQTESCYMFINVFSNDTYEEFIDSIRDFENDKCDKYIIDLRYNPGGSVDGALWMAEHFMPKGKKYLSIETIDKVEHLYSELDQSYIKLNKKNIIFLINEYSASASEMLAKIVRDKHPNTRILGTTSYGKGTIQNIYFYNNGSSFKYTNATRYVDRPSNNINHKGIVPDIIIEDDPDTVEDEVLEYAIDFEF